MEAKLEAKLTQESSENASGSLKLLSVLLPVFNEAATVRPLIDRVLAADVSLALEVVVVDDGSTDDSWQIVSEIANGNSGVRLFRHETNRGKGAAIRTAIHYATGDVAVIQDADLEYDPAEYTRLLAPILAGQADAVYGSRFAMAEAGNETREHGSLAHRTANRLLTTTCNWVTGLRLTDMETCYKMVRMDVLRPLRLTANTFTIEPQLTARLAQSGAVIQEVPISYRHRTYGEGKKIGAIDFAKALGEIFRSGIWDRRYRA